MEEKGSPKKTKKKQQEERKKKKKKKCVLGIKTSHLKKIEVDNNLKYH